MTDCYLCRRRFLDDDIDAHFREDHPSVTVVRQHGLPKAEVLNELAGEIAREAIVDVFRCRCGRSQPCDPCELFGEVGADVHRQRVAWPV